MLFGGNVILQTPYEGFKLGDPKNFPSANKVAHDSFWLGVYPGLNDDIKFMVDKTKEFVVSK